MTVEGRTDVRTRRTRRQLPCPQSDIIIIEARDGGGRLAAATTREMDGKKDGIEKLASELKGLILSRGRRRPNCPPTQLHLIRALLA